MSEDLQARLEQALRERMPDATFEKLYPLACEFLAGGSGVHEPRIMLELKRARAAEAALLRELLALRMVRDQLRDDVSVGRVKLVDECRELSEACREADKARVP